MLKPKLSKDVRCTRKLSEEDTEHEYEYQALNPSIALANGVYFRAPRFGVSHMQATRNVSKQKDHNSSIAMPSGNLHDHSNTRMIPSLHFISHDVTFQGLGRVQQPHSRVGLA